jgi:hypothetical protein
VTAKFEAFKAALHALCVEHGVRLDDSGDDDYRDVRIREATEHDQAGLHVEITDDIPETPEEMAKRQARWEAMDMECRQERQAKEQLRIQQLQDPNGAYQHMVRIAQADALEQRNKQMRISTDPADPAYIDERPRRVTVNDREVDGWAVADEFRRCVILADGRVLTGSVGIERLVGDGRGPKTEEVPAPEAPIATGFSGVLVHVPDAPVATPAPVPAPKAAPAQPGKKHKHRR